MEVCMTCRNPTREWYLRHGSPLYTIIELCNCAKTRIEILKNYKQATVEYRNEDG